MEKTVSTLEVNEMAISAEVLVSTKDMEREEWLEWRRKGIGGSDAAAILGLNRYCSPFDVYLDKIGQKEEQPDNEAMRQGRDFEDYVAFRFAEQTGKKVRRRNVMFQHSEYPFLVGNVDRMVVGEQSGLECKTTSILNKSNFKNGEYPDTYYVQAMHYMAVTGLPKWYLAVLVLNKDFYVFEIERDEAEIAALIEAERYFWEEHVLKEIPPAFDGSKAASECLKAMYPEAEEKLTGALFGYEDKLSEYIALGQGIKHLQTQQEKIKQEIQHTMETAEEGLANGYVVTWKNRTRKGGVDSKKLEAEHPNLYEQYSKPATKYRVFEVKEEE